jgi:hypothetical protein
LKSQDFNKLVPDGEPTDPVGTSDTIVLSIAARRMSRSWLSAVGYRPGEGNSAFWPKADRLQLIAFRSQVHLVRRAE